MSDDAVTPEEVRHVARLARIDLSEEEVERFTTQFSSILDAFETLEAVPNVDRETELVNVLRPDEPRESLDRETALENAPETESDRFKGPNVS